MEDQQVECWTVRFIDQALSDNTEKLQTGKSLNMNHRDQVWWARENEHPTQTLVFTKTAGRHNLVEVIFI